MNEDVQGTSNVTPLMCLSETGFLSPPTSVFRYPSREGTPEWMKNQQTPRVSAQNVICQTPPRETYSREILESPIIVKSQKRSKRSGINIYKPVWLFLAFVLICLMSLVNTTFVYLALIIFIYWALDLYVINYDKYF